ncbi:hypothetical protein BGZ79_007126 [Entomortierella chlamydospora]|nr:hypothetical protein BGZ79_007126 [Entomortierella chlamydospora]
MYAPNRSPRILRTVSQLLPDTFCDFVGEVCYFKPEYSGSGNKAVMAMTDYTQHEKLPFQEGYGKVNGQATILVTLWDEHLQTALDLNVGVGQLLHLQNMLCKLNKNNTIELRMNGFRPGRGYQITEPIRVLDHKDPIAKDLRIRQAQYKQAQSQLADGGMGSQGDSVLSASTVEAVASTPKTETASAATSPSSSQASFEPTVLKKEAESPQKPQTSSIRRYTSKTPSPALLAGGSSSTTPASPTRILTENVRQDLRNHKRNGVQYLKLHTYVKDFSPKQIISQKPDSKVPLRCPLCKKENTLIFKYSFMLTLVDEFQQTYEVNVDNEGARTLLGPTLGNARKFSSNNERFKELKEKLARIGVTEGNPKQDQPIYFDCCIRLNGVQHSRSFVTSALPEMEHYGDDDEIEDFPYCGDEEAHYSGDDVDRGETDRYAGISTQSCEMFSQKRRASDDLKGNGKRPNNNSIKDISSNRGLHLQELDDDTTPCFRASLVFTVII